MVDIAKIVYIDMPYIVKKDSKGHFIQNTRKEFQEGHGHIKRQSTCEMLIRLMKRNQVPDSPYLRDTVLRISTDSKYIDTVRRKIEKDKNKQNYYRPNKR